MMPPAGAPSDNDKAFLGLVAQYIGAQLNGVLNSQFASSSPDVQFADCRLSTTVDRGDTRTIEVRNRGDSHLIVTLTFSKRTGEPTKIEWPE